MKFETISKYLESLNKGAFLFVMDKNKRVNIMTIGWGQVGIMWGKKVFSVPVKNTRFTYDLLKNAEDFTISFPCEDRYKKEIQYVGTYSGRNEDKIKKLNLKLESSKFVKTPHLEGLFHIECKIINKIDTNPNTLYIDKNKFYKIDEFHEIIVGEILN